MNGYFLHLARLALGTGPRLEPRSLPEWEGGWTEAEDAPVPREPLRATERTPEPQGHKAQTPADETTLVLLDPPNVTHEFHTHPSTKEGAVTIVEGAATVHLDSRRTETRATEVRETRESLRELVREARVIRETSTKETRMTEVERAKGLARHPGIERRTEVERLVREIEGATRTRETERTHELRIEAGEPTVEIHIGRIEVRAPAPPHKGEERREKPKGVIGLDEYLRERSRGPS